MFGSRQHPLRAHCTFHSVASPDWQAFMDLHASQMRDFFAVMFQQQQTAMEAMPTSGAKRYSPTTPMRSMQLLMATINPGKAKGLEEVATPTDRWEAKVLALSRDFNEEAQREDEGPQTSSTR